MMSYFCCCFFVLKMANSINSYLISHDSIFVLIEFQKVYEAYKRFCKDKKLAAKSKQSLSSKPTKEYGFQCKIIKSQ